MIYQEFHQVGQIAGDNAVQPDILVIGLGNPILGDDGAGWKIAEEFERQLKVADTDTDIGKLSKLIRIEYLSLGGLSLMENMIGFQYVIVADTIVTKKHPIGSVFHFELEDLPHHASNHLASAHDVSLQHAIEVGRRLGANLPSRIFIVAIESRQVYDFCDHLSPQVEAGIPAAIEAVFECLQEIQEIINISA